jgi:hypothetical protein
MRQNQSSLRPETSSKVLKRSIGMGMLVQPAPPIFAVCLVEGFVTDHGSQRPQNQCGLVVFGDVEGLGAERIEVAVSHELDFLPGSNDVDV